MVTWRPRPPCLYGWLVLGGGALGASAQSPPRLCAGHGSGGIPGAYTAWTGRKRLISTGRKGLISKACSKDATSVTTLVESLSQQAVTQKLAHDDPGTQ
jgi:hypothetical protein